MRNECGYGKMMSALRLYDGRIQAESPEMDACVLDMLHDSSDHHNRPPSEIGIHIYLDCSFEKFVDEHGKRFFRHIDCCVDVGF